ncbi:ARL14 effector protein-like isoform X2 [Augochlora pura]
MAVMDSGNSTSGDHTFAKNVDSTSRAERRITRGSRQRAVDSVTKKFLRNFDPEHSEREKRDDLCDCMNLNCAGCHFPCSKCSSTKCGHDCRINRKWTYDSIENEGSDIVIKNPLLKEA